jgi:hypothetical protein
MTAKAKRTALPARPAAEAAAAHTYILVWKLIGWCVALGGTGWGLMYLYDQTQAAGPQPECRLELADVPEWLQNAQGELIQFEIRRMVGLHPRTVLSDPSVCPWVEQQMRRSPWVKTVTRVSKYASGVVRAWAEYRRPLAFVQVGDTVYLVDRDGVRLPGSYTLEEAVRTDKDIWNDWLRITGVSGSLPEEGQAWTGRDIACGLALVQFLREAQPGGLIPFRHLLRTIDVSNVGNLRHPYGELQIRTIHPRSVIAWGVPLGEEAGIEPSPARKLEMLRTTYTEKGGDFPDGYVYDPRDASGRVTQPEYRDRP